MEIRYAISYRRYETIDPSLTVLIYAADGEGTILSNDPHAIWSHMSYVIPETEISEYTLELIEESLTRCMGEQAAALRHCVYQPEHPATREQVLDLFCRGAEQPISAEMIESVLGIPETTTRWFNHDGNVPAGHVLREMHRRLIPTQEASA